MFSFLGFRQGIEPAGETSRPRRNIPIAVIVSVLLTALIYVGLQIAFIGATRQDSVAGGWAGWALPWFLGLLVTSYLGEFPEQGKRAGNTGLISFGWGFVVVLALSAAAHWLALKVVLPRTRVDAPIDRASAEAEEEDAELGASAG